MKRPHITSKYPIRQCFALVATVFWAIISLSEYALPPNFTVRLGLGCPGRLKREQWKWRHQLPIDCISIHRTHKPILQSFGAICQCLCPRLLLARITGLSVALESGVFLLLRNLKMPINGI